MGHSLTSGAFSWRNKCRLPFRFCIVAPRCSLPSAPLPKCACCQVTSRLLEPTLLETASSWSLCGTAVLEMWRHVCINLCLELFLKDCARSRREHVRCVLQPKLDVTALWDDTCNVHAKRIVIYASASSIVIVAEKRRRRIPHRQQLSSHERNFLEWCHRVR